MRRVNRKCIVCGKEYEYCSGCAGSDPSWKAAFCCENCREISRVLSDHCANVISDEDAYNDLKNCDLSYMSQFKDRTQELINKIVNVNTDIKEKQDKIEPVAELKQENTAENTQIDYKNSNKKKKNKNNKKRK